LLAPSFGKYSDCHGRRRLFTFTSLLTNLPPVSLYFVYMNLTGLWFFYLSLFFLLISPTIIAFLAYISDKTTADEKSMAFGIVLGTIGLITMTGSLLSGFAMSVVWVFEIFR
jgi:MFS family permease